MITSDIDYLIWLLFRIQTHTKEENVLEQNTEKLKLFLGFVKEHTYYTHKANKQENMKQETGRHAEQR